MPSPFPGMNPSLEQEGIWQDFHTSFLAGMSDRLVPRVGAGYVFLLESHIDVHEPEERRQRMRADLLVTRPRAGFWPIGLRDRLPEIPMALRRPTGDAAVDLQQVRHHIYDSS